jgi:hypothetical protein
MPVVADLTFFQLFAKNLQNSSCKFQMNNSSRFFFVWGSVRIKEKDKNDKKVEGDMNFV